MDPPQSRIDHHVRVWLTPTKYRHIRVEVEQKSLAPCVHSAVALAEQVAALAAMLPSAASALYLPHSGHHFPAASFQWRHFLLLLDRVSSSRVVCAQHEHLCSGSGSGRDLIGGMRHAHRTSVPKLASWGDAEAASYSFSTRPAGAEACSRDHRTWVRMQPGA